MTAESLRDGLPRDAYFFPSAASDSFEVVAQSGERRRYGQAPATFIVRVRDLSSWYALANAGAYRIATAFVDGELDIDGDLLAAVRWWHANHVDGWRGWVQAAVGRLRLDSWVQKTGRASARFQDDRSDLFYEQFLDSQMVHSCAFFADPAWSLDQAQVAKLDYICRKLDVRRGDCFLDVGCGWGALLICAAERFGASTVGCTLSRQQLVYARNAALQKGLHGRVLVEQLDYRNIPGHFDKVASVGMYEHVGRHRLERYFRTLARRLEPGGLLLNHGIARPQDTHRDASTAFLRRHVFPGGELPQLADVIYSAERAGFEVLDVENLRPHYALTCAAWVANLVSHRHACLALVEPSIYRTWLLYFAAAAVSFERGQTELYQTLLAKRAGHAPRRLTRTHMTVAPAIRSRPR
jgi:cyclopropane-fatty-acyl-phospholipid synthase